jgi:hypothetical protein
MCHMFPGERPSFTSGAGKISQHKVVFARVRFQPCRGSFHSTDQPLAVLQDVASRLFRIRCRLTSRPAEFLSVVCAHSCCIRRKSACPSLMVLVVAHPSQIVPRCSLMAPIALIDLNIVTASTAERPSGDNVLRHHGKVFHVVARRRLMTLCAVHRPG